MLRMVPFPATRGGSSHRRRAADQSPSKPRRPQRTKAERASSTMFIGRGPCLVSPRVPVKAEGQHLQHHRAYAAASGVRKVRMPEASGSTSAEAGGKRR